MKSRRLSNSPSPNPAQTKMIPRLLLLAAQVARSVVVQVHAEDEGVLDVSHVQVISLSDEKPSLHVRVIISVSVYTPVGDIMFVNCGKSSREHAKEHRSTLINTQLFNRFLVLSITLSVVNHILKSFSFLSSVRPSFDQTQTSFSIS